MKWLFIFTLFFPMLVSAQHGRRKPKVSVARGTLFGYYGYNRSFYSRSTIGFVGPGYDYSLLKVNAKDDPIKFSPAIQLNPLKTTVAQYNTRLGYYFRNHYAVSFGYDKMKYVIDQSQPFLLSGTINPGVDTITDLSGNYNNQEMALSQDKFLYRNAGGVTYLRLEVTRSDQWFAAGKEQQVIFTTNIGAGLGALLTENSFRFAGVTDEHTKSLSGLGLSVHGSVRLEFFKHFFLQAGMHGGFMSQTHVKTRITDQNAYVHQRYAYGMTDLNFGFLLYIHPTNDCQSCPVW